MSLRKSLKSIAPREGRLEAYGKANSAPKKPRVDSAQREKRVKRAESSQPAPADRLRWSLANRERPSLRRQYDDKAPRAGGASSAVGSLQEKDALQSSGRDDAGSRAPRRSRRLR